MKNILLMIVITLSSCIESENTSKNKHAASDSLGEYYTIEIDSCEYVVFRGYQKGGITHKGNCKNHPKCAN